MDFGWDVQVRLMASFQRTAMVYDVMSLKHSSVSDTRHFLQSAAFLEFSLAPSRDTGMTCVVSYFRSFLLCIWCVTCVTLHRWIDALASWELRAFYRLQPEVLRFIMLESSFFELKRRWLTLRIVNKLTCFDIKTTCFAMLFSLLDRTAMVNGHALLDCYSKWSYTDIMPCPRWWRLWWWPPKP